MKLLFAPLALVSVALSATMYTATAASSSASCSGSTCYGTLSFTGETTIDVNEIAKCLNDGSPYISSIDFRSSDDGFSFETTYRTSSGATATAYDCTKTENLSRVTRSSVKCGVDSTGGLQIRFKCNNYIDSCEISWGLAIVCPTPTSAPTTSPTNANTGNGATSSAMSTVAIAATGQAVAMALPAIGAAVAMHV